MNPASEARPPPAGWQRALGLVGLVAHLVVGYLYLAAGLVVPVPWLVVFLIAWVALLVAAIYLLGRHPLWVLAVPVLALGILIGGVSLGGVLLGWSA